MRRLGGAPGRPLLLGALVGALAALLLGTQQAAPAAADSGWEISSFTSTLTIRSDGALAVSENIVARFDAARHGIYRDIPLRYHYNDQYDRVLEISGVTVDNGAGQRRPFTTSGGDVYRIKIGDSSHTVAGRVDYAIHYLVRGALNGFPDHDELYWNATGNGWGVPIGEAQALVTAPPGALGQVACFQGYAGSNQPCQSRVAGVQATFSASGQLAAGQGLTLVTSLAKGAVPDPQPILQRRPRTLGEMFDPSPLDLGLFLLLLLASVALAVFAWWSHGRDQRIAGSLETVIPEFEPPGGLRPAQLGLLLAERAGTRDITATIVDLAARGYLSIEEMNESGFLHARRDYRLKQGTADPSRLQPFESVIWHGLFDSHSEVRLSELRGTFRPDLDHAEGELYKDAMGRRWFTHDPRWAKGGWLAIGIGLTVIGIVLAIALGQLAGLGLPGAGLALGGLVLVALHRWMPQRTAAGHDLLMHTLGFRMYMQTAERYTQQFAEKERIFTSGLPYAIVFGCVDRWAHAFQGIDMAAATAGWYVGTGYLNPVLFSAGLQGFSNTVGSSIAYVPAGSGSSGFGGGGFSGGGVGGGGGGSW